MSISVANLGGPQQWFREAAAVGELAGLGLYERRGQGPPVLILSNPQADPA